MIKRIPSIVRGVFTFFRKDCLSSLLSLLMLILFVTHTHIQRTLKRLKDFVFIESGIPLNMIRVDII